METRIKKNLKFLEGGGEMGELTRSYDWEKTSLGKPENWPLSLQTTVGLVLHSSFPMFLWWGKELLCFYNDAYRPSLGVDGKHPLIGKTAKEGWPDIWDFIGPLIEKVMATGESVWFEDQFLPIYRNGKMDDVYWTFSYSPAYGDDGEIAGVFVTCTETTAKIAALKEMQENANKFRALVEEAPVATCLFTGREMKVEIINDIMIGYWGKGNTVLGKPLAEALPELEGQPFLKLLDDVYTTGESYIAKGALVELEVNGVKGEYYYDFTYKPIRNSHGEIFGIINVSIDATERVLAQRKLENSQKELLSYFEQSPVAIATIDTEGLTFRMANPFYGDLVGRAPEDIINKPLLEALPELKGQGFDKLLEDVITTGIPFIANEVPATLKRKGVLETVYVNLHYQPQQDLKGIVNGILVVATDVTQQVVSRKKIEENEKHLQRLRDAVPAMIFYMDAEQRYRSYNVVFMNWFQVSETEAIGKTTREFIGEEAYTKVSPHLKKAYAGSQTSYEMYAPSRMNGDKWLSIVYTPDIDNKGNVIGVIAHATDITLSKKTEISLRNSESRFRGLIMDAPIATCVFTGKELKIELANEMMLTLWNKPSSIIGMNLKDALHDLNVEPIINILEKVYTSGEPHSEHGAKRELIINGEKQTCYFNYTYKPLFNEQGEVYGIMDMAVDVTEQIKIRLKIEEAVALRTKELAESNLNLKRSNAELEQFAYIASHDLQEPIRKISTFLQLLEHTIPDVSEKSKDYIAKIYSSTDRMTKLIRDVLAFSKITHETYSFEKVDLLKIIETIKIDFDLQIEGTGATIEMASLPIIEAMPSQMTQLFSNLLSNSLKYKKPDVNPVIKISASIARKEELARHPSLDINKTYYHILFSDNGIGFSQDHAERIFRIFQRLHGKTEFDGTGIGLSICKKIVQNHSGHIAAAGGETGGAVFHILLPEGQTIY